MPRYSQEIRAQAVAEYWLTGSYREVARTLQVSDHKRIAAWVLEAEAPKTPQHQRVRARAVEIHERRKTGLDEAYQRALDLQMRDLPGAEFQERTLFIKVIGQQRMLERGKPTSIHEHQGSSDLDAEIKQLLGEMAAKDAAGNGAGH